MIQLVPYGRDHSNPPVTRAAQWPDPPSEMLAEQSCYDCQEVISEGEMPPLKYTLPHPSTKLSSSEKDQLSAGLAALYAQDPPGP